MIKPAHCCALNYTNRNTVSQTTGLNFYRLPLHAVGLRHVIYPQHEDHIVTIDYVTSVHPIYIAVKGTGKKGNGKKGNGKKGNGKNGNGNNGNQI